MSEDKRCRKPPEGMVKKLSLLETVIQGLRHPDREQIESNGINVN